MEYSRELYDGQAARAAWAKIGTWLGGKGALITAVMIPMLLFYSLFWLYPLGRALYISLTDWAGYAGPKALVGLAQYRRAFNDPIFRISLKNTFYYTALAIPSQVAAGLVLAVLIDASRRARGLFRMVYFLPVVTSVVASAIVWKYLYEPGFGLFNELLKALHLPPQQFLLSTTQAMPAIALFALWKYVGYNMVIFSAGLSGIDRTYYDAARIDGANSWQVFWRMTVPLLRPTFVFALVTGMIYALQIFTPMYVMSTRGLYPPGGPVHATRVLVLYQYQTAFFDVEVAYATAIGFILLAIILVVTLMQIRFLRTRWEY